MDIYLANHLFRSVPHGSQLVLIGDADQLPSVGPGAVLREADPVSYTHLDVYKRQAPISAPPLELPVRMPAQSLPVQAAP